MRKLHNEKLHGLYPTNTTTNTSRMDGTCGKIGEKRAYGILADKSRQGDCFDGLGAHGKTILKWI